MFGNDRVGRPYRLDTEGWTTRLSRRHRAELRRSPDPASVAFRSAVLPAPLAVRRRLRLPLTPQRLHQSGTPQPRPKIQDSRRKANVHHVSLRSTKGTPQTEFTTRHTGTLPRTIFPRKRSDESSKKSVIRRPVPHRLTEIECRQLVPRGTNSSSRALRWKVVCARQDHHNRQDLTETQLAGSLPPGSGTGQQLAGGMPVDALHATEGKWLTVPMARTAVGRMASRHRRPGQSP